MPRLLKALAQTASQLCNYSQLGGQVGIDHKTASKYIAVFEPMYLMQRITVWSGNRLSRLLKTPKLQFLDSGLLTNASILGGYVFYPNKPQSSDTNPSIRLLCGLLYKSATLGKSCRGLQANRTQGEVH